MSDYLPHRSLLLLLAVLTLVISPHLLRLPIWESIAVGALIIWRAAASARQWSLPPRLLKLALALAAFAGVYAQYGRVTGQYAGVAMLVLMLALKLTEMRSRRDVMVVVFIMYFLLLTHFLFSQEMWVVLYLLLSATAITTVLIDAHHPGTPMPLRSSLRMGSSMIAQSLPLMLLMFILFPRIPGPLWGLPNDSGAARSGLSDSMTPGSISSLIQSDEVAFRVRFDGEPPPSDQLYWRGPVFQAFNFRTWTAAPEDLRSKQSPQIQVLGPRTRYELTLEPMRSPWLFALDMPDPSDLPANARIDRLGALVLDKPITQRRLIRGVSSTQYMLEPRLSASARAANLRLQEGWNPQTVELAQQWRQQEPEDSALVDKALRMFREQSFVYTLNPPLLERHSVDDFLFNTRRGFCEHYASSFTVLMRAAGVPARVVTGYQGMEANSIGDYYVVRQSDAHAWSEVWLQGRGWVRVDPTAAVSPARIESGLRNAISAADGLPAFLLDYGSLRQKLEARWDWVNARWNEWVLGYGPEIQQQFLSKFGLADMRNMLLALTIGGSLLLGLIGLVALRRAAPPPTRETALLIWQQAGKKLSALGYPQRPDEGPRDYISRVIAREPQLREALQTMLQAYLQIRYQGEPSQPLEQAMRQAVTLIRR